MLSVGQGIIGSAAEENGRKRVDWEEGSAYILPCAKGLACGWIHKIDKDDSNNKQESTVGGDCTRNSDVVIYALKVSPETLTDEGTSKETWPCWVQKSYELFRKCLEKKEPESSGDSSDDENNLRGIPLSKEDSLSMELIVELAG